MTEVVVVPDLHGRLDLLLAAVREFPAAHFLSLGDAIDRGPRSLGTVDKLLELHAEGRATLLMGNHERMAQEGLRWYKQYTGTHDLGDYRKAMEGYQWWMQAGGSTVRKEIPHYAAERGGPGHPDAGAVSAESGPLPGGAAPGGVRHRRRRDS